MDLPSLVIGSSLSTYLSVATLPMCDAIRLLGQWLPLL